MTNVDLSILVVLYGKKISNSTTIRSLKNIIKYYPNYNLVVWNNGPNIIEKEPMGFDYHIINTIENKSLSSIYNDFIRRFPAEKYYIFDDDSIVNFNFFKNSFESKNDVAIPKIIHGNQQLYPKSNKKRTVIGDGTYFYNDIVVSIGSGICLNKTVVYKLLKSYTTVFDERFKFYGVDTTFFHRLNTLESVNILVCGDLYHSLSRLTNESLSKLTFRRRERSIDLALQLRHYNSFLVMISSIKFIFSLIKNGNYSAVLIYFKSLFLGKHPDI
ncbi:hypothetical protein KW474_15860 [Vibrio fluvialis]|nr:hypothetical protein [Vibrio fluvialis]